MKKEKVMLIFSLLILLCAVVLFQMSSTYAKYNTAVKGNDSARVAHWHINTTNNIVQIKKAMIVSFASLLVSSFFLNI